MPVIAASSVVLTVILFVPVIALCAISAVPVAISALSVFSAEDVYSFPPITIVSQVPTNLQCAASQPLPQQIQPPDHNLHHPQLQPLPP